MWNANGYDQQLDVMKRAPEQYIFRQGIKVQNLKSLILDRNIYTLYNVICRISTQTGLKFIFPLRIDMNMTYEYFL